MDNINWIAVANGLAALFMAIWLFWDRTKGKTMIIKPSEKTGGAFHISEEALRKYNEIRTKIEGELMASKDHELLCRGNLAILLNEVSDKIAASQEKILAEIKNNKGKNGKG